jgi:hypothetical protein
MQCNAAEETNNGSGEWMGRDHIIRLEISGSGWTGDCLSNNISLSHKMGRVGWRAAQQIL